MLDLFSHFAKPFLIVLSLVYFTQGARSFPSIAVSFLLKDKLRLSPADSEILQSNAHFPWSCKLLYGIVSDMVPIFGSRRKSYLILASLTSSICWFSLYWHEVNSASLLLVFLFFGNVATATSDVVVDALVAEVTRADEDDRWGTKLQSLSWGMMSIGGLLGSLLSGPLLAAGFEPNHLFALFSLCPLLTLIAALFMQEGKLPQTQQVSMKGHLTRLWQALRQPQIYRYIIFLFLSRAIVPSFNSAMFFYQTQVLAFDALFISRVQSVMWAGLTVGSLMHSRYFAKISFNKMFFYCELFMSIAGALELLLVMRMNVGLGISDHVLVIVNALLSNAVSTLKLMPFLALSAKLCPEGVEGTLFAILMSTINFGSLVSGYFGGSLCSWLEITETNFEHLWIALSINIVASLLPLCFTFLIPVVVTITKVD